MRGYFFSELDHRAIVRVRATGPIKTLDLTFEIDTGASEQLFIGGELAEELGLKLDKEQTATLANGSEVIVFQAKLQIEWLDGAYEVDATVWPINPDKPRGRRSKNKPDGLIGQALLLQSHLSIDYVNRKVVLTKPVIEGA